LATAARRDGAAVFTASHGFDWRAVMMAGRRPAHVQTLARLLRAGRIGTVTHVSCVDRRARGVERLASADVEYVQLLAYGADHLAWVRDLLGVDPVGVMARCGRALGQSAPHGTLTEAFLSMASGVHVQYHGSLAFDGNRHELWIDGERGTLRSDGYLVWLRRKGWPRFAPVALSFRGFAGAASSPAATAAARRERLGALERGGPAAAVDDHDRWSLAIARAVMRADRSGRLVALGEPIEAAAPTAVGGSAA
jgi:predicted dehydrogenase